MRVYVLIWPCAGEPSIISIWPSLETARVGYIKWHEKEVLDWVQEEPCEYNMDGHFSSYVEEWVIGDGSEEPIETYSASLAKRLHSGRLE